MFIAYIFWFLLVLHMSIFCVLPKLNSFVKWFLLKLNRGVKWMGKMQLHIEFICFTQCSCRQQKVRQESTAKENICFSNFIYPEVWCDHIVLYCQQQHYQGVQHRQQIYHLIYPLPSFYGQCNWCPMLFQGRSSNSQRHKSLSKQKPRVSVHATFYWTSCRGKTN